MSDRITVIHAPRDSDHKYFALSRAVPQHSQLSFEARGVLCYLLSKPDDWVIRIQDLMREGDCGRDRIYRILKELKEHGYLHRDRIRRTDGTFEWGAYRVYEIPHTENTDVDIAQQKAIQPLTEKPYTEKPDTGKPYTENTYTYRIESNTDKRELQKRESGKDRTNTHAPAVQVYFEIYPNETLSPKQVDAIGKSVTDLDRWRQTLNDWALNEWNAKSIGKMLDRYSSGRTIQDDRPSGGTSNGHKPPDSRPALEPFTPKVRPHLSPAEMKAALEKARSS